MQFVSEYGLFLAKVVTLVLALVALLSLIIGLLSKGKEAKNRLHIKKLNEKYTEFKNLLNEEILTKSQFKKEHKLQKKIAKTQENTQRKRLFVLDFNGDIKATPTSSLREEVTAILTIAKPDDEVLLRLESPGGIVPYYGLAASQLQRLREKNIFLTVSVDKMAASGGYLMACVANKILAAPYAIIGSIGVVAQLPNFHRLLKKNDIDFEQITAGAYKRTLSLFGENTEKGREKVQEDVDNIHTLFKDFILAHRDVDMAKVATGEHWHGVHALELKLIDGLITSDDYLLNASAEKDIYEVHFVSKKSLANKLGLSIRQQFDKLFLTTHPLK